MASDGAFILSVLGGKITTYRKLAEQAVAKLGSVLDIEKAAWTSTAPLPGGDVPGADIDGFIEVTAHQFPWLPDNLLRRYTTSYGSRISLLLDSATCLHDLGAQFGPGLYECEVRYLVTHEWARTAEDILWRRTKLGLHVDKPAAVRLQNWLNSNVVNQGLDIHASKGAA